MFCADKLVAETHPGIHPSSGTCPLARGGICFWVDVVLACELSKWSIKATVEVTSWVLWDATVTLAKVVWEGGEIPVVYLCEHLCVYNNKGEQQCYDTSVPVLCMVRMCKALFRRLAHLVL